MNHFILSLVSLVFFVFDSIFAQLFAGHFLGRDYIFVPYFMIIFVFFLTIYGSRKYGMIYGAILGLAYDVVYTEVLGIYMFLIPFLVYLLAKCMKVLHTNWMIVTFLSLLFVLLSEIVIYELNVIMSFAKLSFIEFVQLRLLPTAGLNFLFIILFFYPLKRLILRLFSQGEGEL